eukprot:11315242-Karenia_brevis.AAC.1
MRLRHGCAASSLLAVECTPELLPEPMACCEIPGSADLLVRAACSAALIFPFIRLRPCCVALSLAAADCPTMPPAGICAS